jgi:hypothetical protein
MFYYLIFNSTLSNYPDIHKKLITTILYGSILYIVLHAYLSISSSLLIQNLKPYFWLVYTLDCASIGYLYLNMETSNETLDGISKIRELLRNYLTDTPSQSLNSSTGTGTFSTTLKDIQSIQEEQTPLSQHQPNTNTSGVMKHTMSTDLDDLLKQRIQEQNMNQNQKKETTGSDSGSDIGSIMDIDINEFEASLSI